MAATTVRVLFEFRNGNKNYLRTLPHGGRWVPCNGEFDLESFDAAYLIALEDIKIARQRIIEHLEKHRPPSHD